MYLRKNGQTAELAQDDWLEILLAEEMTVTVVVNHFFLLQLHWDVCLKKKNTKTLLLLLFVPGYFKVNNEHLLKEKQTGHSFSKI